MVDIVVLNYNDAKQTIEYLKSIQCYKNIEHVVVVDNNSTDKSYYELIKYENEKIKIIQSGNNGGYGFGNNCGIKYLVKNYNSKYLAITNPDVKYKESCLTACEEFLKSNKEYVIVAPRMKNIKGEIVNNAAWMIPTWKEYAFFSLIFLGRLYKLNYTKLYKKNQYLDIDCVAGSMLVINTEAFLRIGMFDERTFLYCEEVIIGIKAKRSGYKTALLIRYNFTHMHSVSIDKAIRNKINQLEIMWDSRIYTLKKYYKINKIQVLIVQFARIASLVEVWFTIRIYRKIFHEKNKINYVNIEQ